MKKFTTYHHLIVMLYVTLEGFQSIREVILGLLSNAHKLSHLGLTYLVRRSTFSDANQRRSSKVFEDIYMGIYRKYSPTLADSRLSDKDMRRLYIMDSTTMSLFKDILKGVGRNPKEGRKKGGIKAHTIIKASENVPCLIRYSEAARHDHMFLSEIFRLPKGSIITFDKAYVDYEQYEAFTQNSVWYVTRLKDNALYEARQEYENNIKEAEAAAGLARSARRAAGCAVNDDLLVRWLTLAATRIADARSRLTDLDAAIGDGDHGINLDRGFRELERRLAAFLGVDDAILYSSCFDANGGLFETLLGEPDAILSDALNHASLIDGTGLAPNIEPRPVVKSVTCEPQAISSPISWMSLMFGNPQRTSPSGTLNSNAKFTLSLAERLR